MKCVLVLFNHFLTVVPLFKSVTSSFGVKSDNIVRSLTFSLYDYYCYN